MPVIPVHHKTWPDPSVTVTFLNEKRKIMTPVGQKKKVRQAKF